MFDTLNIHIDFKSPPFLYDLWSIQWWQNLLTINNGWKVPADEEKQQSVTELENIT